MLPVSNTDLEDHMKTPFFRGIFKEKNVQLPEELDR